MKNSLDSWVKEFPASITICDREGVIIGMNDHAAKSFQEDGGLELIGKSVLDCHPEAARRRILQMMEDRQPNIYTIEKQGVKKMIYQSPWFENDQYAGFLEITLKIPFEMPHFVRD